MLPYDDAYTDLNTAYNPLRPGGQILGNHHENIIIRPSPLVQDEQYIIHTLVIDSRDRDMSKYPNSNDYVIDLSSTFKDIVSLELLNLVVAKGEETINRNNNTFTFGESQQQLDDKRYTTVTVPSGQYDAASLSSALAQEMSAASTNATTYTVTPDPKTGRLSINGTGGSGDAFAVISGRDGQYTQSNISKMLGFQPGISNGTVSNGKTSLSGSNAINLNGEDYIVMVIDDISNNHGSNGSLQGSFAHIVLADIGYGQFKHLRGVDWGRCLVRFNPIRPTIFKFHIRFKRGDGRLYDFGGFENSMVFELKCKFKARDY